MQSCLPPILVCHARLMQHGPNLLLQDAVETLCNPILLWGVGLGVLMFNAFGSAEVMHGSIDVFPPSISADNLDLSRPIVELWPKGAPP